MECRPLFCSHARLQDRLAPKPQALSYSISQPRAATVYLRDGCHCWTLAPVSRPSCWDYSLPFHSAALQSSPGTSVLGSTRWAKQWGRLPIQCFSNAFRPEIVGDTRN